MWKILICTFLGFMLISFAEANPLEKIPAPAQEDSKNKAAESPQIVSDEGQGAENLQELLDGFENQSDAGEKEIPQDDVDPPSYGEKVRAEQNTPSIKDEKPLWHMNGEFEFTSVYNFAPSARSPWSGFSMVRPGISLAVSNTFSDKWRSKMSLRGFYDTVYCQRGRHNYTEQVLNAYEDELELGDTYVLGQLTEHVDVKIGRQIVVWGNFDNLRVVDVLNPLDLRVPGLTDIEYLRLPVTMIRLDHYSGAWDLSGMLIPEVRFSKMPVFGSDFYPYSTPPPEEDKPDHGFNHCQYAIALTGAFAGWDMGLYWADIYDDQTYLTLAGDEPQRGVVREHARLNLLGTAGNLAVGDWVLKMEAAWIDGLQYTNTPGVEYRRLDVGAGVEYSGFKEMFICLEAVNRHIYDYDLRLKFSPDQLDQDEFQWAVRVAKDFINSTLTLTCLVSTFGVKAEDGLYERFEAKYKFTDAIGVKTGFVIYQSGDNELYADLENNNRLFAVLTYSF